VLYRILLFKEAIPAAMAGAVQDIKCAQKYLPQSTTSGSCGMASAGKDTEGSQFFITHIATPHLDGRYTIFAKVVKGMEVVDRLQIGDTIQTMR
jgi:cyclophilin family peptidyl-prolyl cis-trans isomerase